jgi:hypothetical protein
LAGDLLKLALFDRLRYGAQPRCNCGPMAVDFAQDHMPARLRVGDHAIDVVELRGQRLRRDRVRRQATLYEKFVDLRTCRFFAGVPLLGEGAGALPSSR